MSDATAAQVLAGGTGRAVGLMGTVDRRLPALAGTGRHKRRITVD
jgi:hypothetical protein